jgi:SLOG cluster2
MNYDGPKANPAMPSSKGSGRPLEGLAVGISVAVGEDSAQHGCSEEEINRTIVRLSDALLSSGARLVFGHDWRPSGVMSSVARLAVSYDLGTAVADDQSTRRSCRITNLVPWDRKPELPADLREDLEMRGMLHIEEVSLPATLAQREDIVGRRTLRAAGLCVLRRRLAELCDARICLGGKFQNFEGFWPGILEEALTSAASEHGRKILLSGMLGGAAARILESARSGEWDDFIQINRDAELRKGFEQLRILDAAIFPNIAQVPELLNWNILQLRSDLAEDDWNLLADANDIEVVAALAIKALRTGTPREL